MNALGQRIAGLIRATGPMPVAHYMAMCLYDAETGYYTTRDPLGRTGDFTTAPEVSQMFGELIGAWLVAVWRMAGSPTDAVFAEIGPGHGTLSRDIARTFDRLEPGLRAQSEFLLIETSPTLSAIQARTLEDVGGTFRWVTAPNQLPDGRPLFIVGNELLDAIPARQFVKTTHGWCERCVGLDDAGAFQFVAGAAMIDPAGLPSTAVTAPIGAIYETAPAREALVQNLTERVARHGGAALLIDYGHLEPGLADTFQAIRAHAFADPLQEPGEADLTTHVDFAALSEIVKADGLAPHTTTQGDFLIDLGLLERAGRLGAGRHSTTQDRLRGEVERLAGPDAMGDLFKVLAFSNLATPLPGFPPMG